ncbi:anaerobic C4-dicarboxylate transporter, partial [Miniimonas arenae]|uniref:anaerobic C4-dicarboxylate transporter n=1 Tax=Miniimonas arenae TaxID=676201 RepID=UPI0028AA9D2F
SRRPSAAGQPQTTHRARSGRHLPAHAHRQHRSGVLRDDAGDRGGKENDVRPQRALTIGVAASLVAITASPISASVLFMSSLLEDGDTGWDYLLLLAIVMPATLLAVLATSVLYLVWDRARGRTALSTLPEYAERLRTGEARPPQPHEARDLPPGARRSVVIFVVGLVAVLTYAVLTSERVGLVDPPAMNGAAARVAAMLTVALAILVLCRGDVKEIPSASTFKVGMTACTCILGVAWLGSTFVNNHSELIGELAGDALVQWPWLLAVVMILASSLLYSQAATAQALMPTALALGVAPAAIVAAFPATSGMFILPTYPTLLAAAELDDTGSTRLGRHVFDHPFLVPGLIVAGLSVTLSFVFAGLYGA